MAMNSAGETAAAALPPIEESVEEFPEDAVEQDAEPTETPTEDAPETISATEEQETPVEEPAAEHAEDMEALRNEANVLRQLNKAMVDNPVGFMQWFMQNNMTAAQREQVVQPAAAPAPKDVTADWGAPEELAPSERYLKETAPAIETLRENVQYIKDLPRWAGGVQETQQALVTAATTHQGEIETLKSTVNALAQALGMKLPDAKDPKAYVKALEAEAAKVITKQNAAKTQVPRSVRQGAGDGDAEGLGIKASDDFAAMFRKVKAARTR